MPTLTICVTVDWEGVDLEQANLDAMSMFRGLFPAIPLTHFICPAYLTRGDDLGPIVEQINGQVRDGDEVALHVHCWQTLLTAACVQPVLEPSWYLLNNGPEVPYGDGQLDIGHGVPLGIYQPGDIGKIIVCGNQLLVTNGIAPATPPSFRCGGWMSADPVQTALQAQGVANDSSSTDAPYFAQIQDQLRAEGDQLGDWLVSLWGNQAVADPAYLANTQSRAVKPGGGTSTTQPYMISRVLQVPDNGVLADYLTQDMMYNRLVEAWTQASQADFVHVCGFHQESATWENMYHEETPNLANLAAALIRFLAGIGQVGGGQQAVGGQQQMMGGAQPFAMMAGGGTPQTSGGQQVVFNTASGVAKGLPGVQVSVPPKMPATTKALPQDMKKRFWG